MLIKFIINIDHPVYTEQFVKFMENYPEDDHLKYEVLDTGSKKHLRKARGYFSKYASSEMFVVFEDEAKEKDKVLDVIYKETANRGSNSWYSLLESKLHNLSNEHQ